MGDKPKKRSGKRLRKLTKLQRKHYRYEKRILPILTRDFDDPFILVVVRDDFNLMKGRTFKLNSVFKNPEKIEGCVTHIYEKKLKHNHLGIFVNMKDRDGSKTRVYLSPKLITLIKNHSREYLEWIDFFIGKRNIFSSEKQTNKYFFPAGYIFSKEEQEQYRGVYRINDDGTLFNSYSRSFKIDEFDFKARFGYYPNEGLNESDEDESDEFEDESDS